jgi:error-prone DNA polymerase
MPLGEHVLQDYQSISMSLKKHLMALLRDRMSADGVVAAARLGHIADGERATVAGLVLVRQQPVTASGVIFVTIEDETGIANIILWPNVFRRYRRPLLESRILEVTGKLQKGGAVIHVVADSLVNRSDELRRLSEVDGEFERAMARADGVKGGGSDPPYATPKGRAFK